MRNIGGLTFSLWLDIVPIAATEIEVDGAWSQWSNWTGCSATCDGGIRVRERDCLSTEGSAEEEYEEWKGNDVTFVCNGAGEQIEECNTESCSFWGEWSNWSACDAECAGGTRTRTRDCKNAHIHL